MLGKDPLSIANAPRSVIGGGHRYWISNRRPRLSPRQQPRVTLLIGNLSSVAFADVDQVKRLRRGHGCIPISGSLITNVPLVTIVTVSQVLTSKRRRAPGKV